MKTNSVKSNNFVANLKNRSGALKCTMLSKIFTMIKKEDVKMRRKVIAANWKMNKNPENTKEFLKEFIPLVKDTENDVIIFAPYIDIPCALEMTSGTNVKIGAENIYFEDKGAYTGEISPKMLADMGIQYTIVGHSERRQYFDETDEIVNKKVKAALRNGLHPVLCIGENIDQRKSGSTRDVITSQLTIDLQDLTADDVSKVIIAYEPIWAISTSGIGQVATPDDAEEACLLIRDFLREKYGDVADGIIIQYGGSVNPTNVDYLMRMEDIDGGLVGGASLKVEDFARVVNFIK